MAGHNCCGNCSASLSVFQVKNPGKTQTKESLFAAGSSFKQQYNLAMGHDLPLAQIIIAVAFPIKCIKLRFNGDRTSFSTLNHSLQLPESSRVHSHVKM